MLTKNLDKRSETLPASHLANPIREALSQLAGYTVSGVFPKFEKERPPVGRVIVTLPENNLAKLKQGRIEDANEELLTVLTQPFIDLKPYIEAAAILHNGRLTNPVRNIGPMFVGRSAYLPYISAERNIAYTLNRTNFASTAEDYSDLGIIPEQTVDTITEYTEVVISPHLSLTDTIQNVWSGGRLDPGRIKNKGDVIWRTKSLGDGKILPIILQQFYRELGVGK